jgi:hypothetical protein
VLRGFAENRYLVAFAGDERVVDSALALTAGEIIYGRVVGLGDRVELQRLYGNSHEKAIQRESMPLEARPAVPAPAGGFAIDNLLQRYRVDLNEADRSSLLRAARNVDDPEAMGLAGAMLSKLGLPQTGVLLEALYRAQFATGPTTAGKVDSDFIPEVVASGQQTAQLQASSVRQLADLVGRLLEQPGSQDTTRTSVSNSSDEGARRKPQGALAARILNAQTGGVVAHRSGLLPLLVGGNLVEVSFALFEQRRPPNQPQGLQHRQVTFSLHTQHLGRVDVVARITGGHVRVEISTDNEERTSRTARYTGQLEDSLAENGWSIDEVAYATRSENPHNAVVRSVIEHVVSLDSLNRLV